MKTTSFIISKKTLINLLDEWLDEDPTLKIEIMPIRVDEYLVYYHEHEEHQRI